MFNLLPSLDRVVLSHNNNLSGLLPLSLGNSNVTCLRLNNQGVDDGFSGSITIIASMRLLSQAWLNGNHLSDSIPASFASTKLSDLQLRSNYLTGLVPRSLFNLISLKEISLDYNLLEGPVPMFDKHIKATWESNNFCRSDVGPSDPQVTIFFVIFESFGISGNPLLLGGNDVCTNVTTLIKCQRGKVVSLDLALGIQYQLVLNGTISPAFSNLTSLVNLNLSGNNLTSPIPEILTTLPHLKLLDVSNNNLSGPIPKFPSKVKVITRGNVLLGQYATSPNGNQSKTTRLCIILIAGASLFSMYPTLIQRGMFKETVNPNKLKVEDFNERCNLSPIKQYSYADVQKMTNSFKEKLGEGGFAVVYKASLPDGRPVAVKIINDGKADGQDFMNELDSISRTAHVNIVSLLGFCCEHKIALIYEFMTKGSLDKFIMNTGLPDGICSLDRNTMCKIAIGIAKGLDYLHQGCASRIVHLDIKPHNILLDDDFCPKIADFGLAKICQKNVSAMSGVGGTRGYMAPEIFDKHKVSEKSDIYSYGMLIIDMIGRRYNNNAGGSDNSEYFPDWIYNDLQQGNNLVNSFEISEEENDIIRKITMVCLWCIQFKASDRPSSGKVVQMLQGSLESIPFPRKPSLYSQEVPSFPSPSSSSFIDSKSASLLKTGSIKSDRFVSCRYENGALSIE
ncbi:putative glycerophosphodiester phosphodiesterase, protein kinase RLK-Pelle-LRK10L-2 family [Medicago truncatula]|uniref:Putative glycerophosphodiester phosphodiesterase, protein kinase RLK-Pelle-LRK10L-2 family n=1 Tax=Medicago truncatula TaxID=3880 RepID=A0A396H4M4_MEDTR|nr:putative glycerophosphodiester phosphodiesterase, protein kinase RLK-Pelle-LRK10L-2 family [Medicago truncatula]